MMNNKAPLVTATELIQSVLRDSLDVPVFSRVPKEKPRVFFLVDQGVPVNTLTVHDRTPVIIRAYSQDIESTLEAINDARRTMWGAQVGSLLGWAEYWGPHENQDPDLPTWHVWQIGGNAYQSIP